MSDLARAEATRRGKSLLKRMPGTGWRLHVWENLGWHYEIANGPLSITEHGGEYMPLLGDRTSDRRCGSCNWNVGTQYSTPERALRAQLKAARKYVTRVDALVTQLEEATGG